MTQGTPRDVVTDTSRMERVQQSGSIARLGWPQDTSTDWEGDIPKDQDKVRDCRERCSSGTGRNDSRGRQLPSPFLFALFTRCNPITSLTLQMLQMMCIPLPSLVPVSRHSRPYHD
uniref:Uncharacterized protein n=1 Tax=Aeromonas hydrophila TaxID=644 RepID=Q5YL31_AERHY|nr:unknown [Aeromonas hydrophila]